MIYALSFLSLAATIARLIKVAQFAEAVDVEGMLSKRMDYTYWAVVEVMTAIVCANLPAMPFFVRRLSLSSLRFPRLASGSNGYCDNGEHASNYRSCLCMWMNKFLSWLQINSDSTRKEAADRFYDSQLGSKEGFKGRNDTPELDIALQQKGTNYGSQKKSEDTKGSASISQDYLTVNSYDPKTKDCETVIERSDTSEHSMKSAIYVTREIDIESNKM